MNDIKKDLLISAELGHRLYTITMDNTESVGHALMASIFNVCLLAESAPIEVKEEHIVDLLREGMRMVKEAAMDEATSMEAAKYGIQ